MRDDFSMMLTFSLGFEHAGFALRNESMIHKSAINTSEVPPGALITLLQKGLQYVDIEWRLDSVRQSFFSIHFPWKILLVLF